MGMTFSLTLLGTNSAIPAHGRFPTAQVLNVHEQLFLIDCGEGTQMRLNDFHIRRSKINQIFISHLHGDHIFGLIGLLTSYSLAGRTEPLSVFSPDGLEEIIRVQVKNSNSGFSYPLQFHVLDPSVHQLIFSNEAVEVYTLPLVHRIPTCGFLFRERAGGLKIRAEKIQEYQIPYPAIRAIKSEGADFTTADGRVIPNAELTFPPSPPRSYAYCSDTMYNERLIPYIYGVDLLYHETTFAEDRAANCAATMHSTAKQAATIAQKAAVGQLICGHYSSRYADLSVILEEARSVFENSELGVEGKVFEVERKSTV